MGLVKMIIKILIFIFVFCLSSSALATDYYVSFSTGADTNAGTEVAPFKYAPGMVGCSNNCVTCEDNLTGGDTVYLKKGDTWTNECLTVNASGSSGNPITFDAYGSGALPIIDGNDNASYWKGAFVIIDKSYITVKNIRVQNTEKETFGIRCEDGGSGLSNIILDGVEIVQGYSGGGAIDGYMCLMVLIEDGGGAMSNITIQNCTLEDTGHNCVRFWPRDSSNTISNVTFQDNTLCDCDHHGIDFWRYSGEWVSFVWAS